MELCESGGLLEVGVSVHRSQESVVKAQVQSNSWDQLRATDGGVEPECTGGLDGGQLGGRAFKELQTGGSTDSPPSNFSFALCLTCPSFRKVPLSRPLIYLFVCFYLFLMWTIFKVFITFVTTLLLFFCWFSSCEACGVLGPWPGIRPASPAQEGKVLRPPDLQGSC